jgi:hypothetical protein
VTPAAIGGLLTPDHGLVGIESLLNAVVQQAKLAGVIFEFPVEVLKDERFEDVVDLVSLEAQFGQAKCRRIENESFRRGLEGDEELASDYLPSGSAANRGSLEGVGSKVDAACRGNAVQRQEHRSRCKNARNRRRQWVS